MEKYADKNRNSGIEAYKITSKSIKIKFKNSHEIYEYSYKSAGKKHVEKMKILALEGLGLNTYISKFVSDKFE